MSKQRRFTSAVLAMLFMIGGALTLAPPASAASCYGHYCSNRDPAATGCSGGAWTQTAVDTYWRPYFGGGIITSDVYAGRLELRGSNTCGSTQWARFTPQDRMSYEIWVEQPETGYVTDWQKAGPWQSSWSNQIYSPSKCIRARVKMLSGMRAHEYTTTCL